MTVDGTDLSGWDLIPDSLLLEIYTYLDITTLGRAALVCWKWNRCAMDDKLWCRLARVVWKIPKGSVLKNNKEFCLFYCVACF